ncbi:AAA family ATPase [Streptomyces asiaticus]|uniref:AAA family ATPase n=1 Tax=Streptomyces asiaticus TaxID=114695 RepID=UPI0038291D71
MSEGEDAAAHGPERFLTVAGTVSETGRPADQREPTGSDGSDTSDALSDAEFDERLLAAVRDGAWLDSQDFPPLSYAIGGLLPEGFSLLIGPPKAGKSWLALDFLLAISGGRYAVGKIAMAGKRRVLYLALEDGDRRMQDRCRTILGDEQIPDLFHYMTDIQPGFVVKTIQAFLRRYPDTALVIIDTLGKVMPPSMPGESAYQRDYRVAGALKRVADAHPGLAISALHHDRKAASDDFVDSVSGTHGLAGAADTIIVLARKRQASEAVLMVTGRDVMEAEYALVMDGGLWQLDGVDLAEAASVAQQREDSAGLGDKSVEILAFIRQHDAPVRAGAVAEKFGKDAYQYLGRLEESGRLIKVKRGWYRATEMIPGTEETP